MTGTDKRDHLIPWYFVAFFVCIAAVDAVMVTLAIRTNTGMVTDHPYEKGLVYNQVVQAEQAQAQLGWNADIEYEAGVLRVVVQDRNGAIVTPDRITARFTRPIHAGRDFEVELKEKKTTVLVPEKGQWNIRIFATLGNKTYQQSRRVVVQ